MKHFYKKFSTESNKFQRLYPSYNHVVSNHWNLTVNGGVSSKDLIFPVFLSDNRDSIQPIISLPDQFRVGTNKIAQFLEPMVNNGLQSVLLFGCIENHKKDPQGTCADVETNPVVEGIKQIKKYFPELYIICDICLCAYSCDGFCGVVDPSDPDKINVQQSIKRLAEISTVYSQAGCHCVAPSDMLDNRVFLIDQYLADAGLRDDVAIMSYAAKFSSSLFGPFRDACKSNYCFGKKRPHQLPIGSQSLAHKAINRDINQGSDFIIVKPGSWYLDVISSAKANRAKFAPIIAYQVSGEYAMLYYASKHGALNLESALDESLTCFKRAGTSFEDSLYITLNLGCSAVISYFTPQILGLIKQGRLV